jgi:arylsulfatase A-like enzyme
MLNKYLLALLLVLGLTLLGFSLFYFLPGPKQADPNVVLIVIDALRADRLMAQRNGVDVMPHLAERAQRAVTFANAKTPCSWTRPAMASIFTSRYVDTHQVYYSAKGPEGRSDRLGDDWETLPEFLQKHGYDTLAFQTNGNLTRELGFAQGFDEDRYLFGHDRPADEVTGKLLEHIPQLEEPFFVYGHYIDPHVPYAPPADYAALFGPHPALSASDEAIFASDESFMAMYNDCVRVSLGLDEQPTVPRLSAAGEAWVNNLYDGEARFADEQVQRLLTRIEANYPNTLIIIVADHGEEFWERTGMGHGTNLYEEQVHVPLLIQAPDLPARMVTDSVETMGILPTVASYLSLPVNPNWQGRDLLASGHSQDLPVFSRTLGAWIELRVDQSSIELDGYKLLVDESHQKEVLFQLSNDPGEQINLIKDKPRIATRLRTLLTEHRATNLQLHKESGRPEESVVLDPQTRAEMEALGYFTGADNEDGPINVRESEKRR